MTRPLFVSNRLAVRVVEDGASVDVQLTNGGLATALRHARKRTDARWLGWPGRVSQANRAEAGALLHELGAYPVFLEDEEVARYYDGFSNGVLWPLFHCSLDKLPFDVDADWVPWRDVNRRFAAACLSIVGEEDPIWLHDFHLVLVPGEIRRVFPRAKVGFFLHIPFPPLEVFRVLPHADEVVVGMLGADVIGFHTSTFADAFKAAAAAVGARVVDDVVEFAGHVSRVGVFPISVDYPGIESCAKRVEVKERVQSLRAGAHGRTILLGVDRLDYTKGLPRRFLAIERLLERWPDLAPQLHFIQVAVPTRENVDAYAGFRDVVNRIVGRVNGKFGTATGVPIHFMHRELEFEELMALYGAADVMIVTPLRDGMNLVCKEYIAARADERGALVLSQFAGAADELDDGALLVNPYDIEEVARRLHEAILMPVAEQTARMTALRRQVRENDVHMWSERFLTALDAAQPVTVGADIERLASTPHLHIVLDYDGTLMPISSTPSEADPDPELLELLQHLASTPQTTVHVASGRDRSTLGQWLGHLPIALTAEHGASSRPVGGEWSLSKTPPWLREAERALHKLAASAPGSFVEAKTSTVALHTRGMRGGDRRAFEAYVSEVLARVLPEDVEVMTGDCVVEVRTRGVNKGRVISTLHQHDDGLILVAGDDITDEDMFVALPPGSIAVGVGPRARGATMRVSNPAELRVLLARIAGARGHLQQRRATVAPSPTM